MRKTQRKGEKQERFFFEELKGIYPDLAPSSNSGARFGNGDFSTKHILFDVKSSEGDRFSALSGDEWRKIREQALSQGKDFIVPVKMKGGEAALLIPLDFAKVLLKLWRAYLAGEIA